MATTFLTHGERESYNNIPELDEEEFIQAFYLTKTDKGFLNIFASFSNRFSVALQICLIRYFGFLEDSWRNQISDDIAEFIITQLGYRQSANELLKEYGNRPSTRSVHLQQILKYLNIRRWEPILDEPIIEKWLIERGMEHDNERWLLNRLCQKLHQDKIFRPSIGTLERIVAYINERLHQETYRRVEFLLTEGLQEKLDKILEMNVQLNMPIHRWLCRQPTSNTAKAINQTLEKISFLQQLGVDKWDMSSISINRKKRLANIARNNSNSYLQRLNPKKRYPILICFVWESLLDTTDIVLVMYNDFWLQANNTAKKSLEAYQQGLSKIKATALQSITDITLMAIDENIDSITTLRENIYEKYSNEHILQAISLIKKGVKKNMVQTQLDFLLDSYPRFKQFTVRLLTILTFEIAFLKDNFDSGLQLLIELQKGTKRKLPLDASKNFVTTSWSKLINQYESNEPQAYELCVLSVLKDRLQSGDVFVANSRKFADFNSFLIPKLRWEKEGEIIRNSLGAFDVVKKIDEMAAELASLLQPLSEHLQEGTLNGHSVRIENGNLVVPDIEAEELSPSVLFLREQIKQRLPQVELAEIIREVDTWVNYSFEFREGFGLHTESLALKYAALMGTACNISFTEMASSADLDYNSLLWVANNYFSEENLKNANTKLVNYHHKLWLSAYWGDGTLSSSDGQRFPTRGKIRNAKSIPRYFGFGKGVTLYVHVSDQYSQYGAKSITSTERDATYVLDEILANETDLDIQEHTTDTHGYTDLLFALFNLSRKQLISRLRDIGSQKLCKILSSSNPEFGQLNYPELRFNGLVNIDYLKKHAQELARVGASLLTGTVTASLLMSKLQSYPRQNNLMYILLSYGQLEKTIFICKYLLRPPMRKKATQQLNKVEQLNNLRKYLNFGGDGYIRKQQELEQQTTAKTMSNLTNIVIIWNTVYIQEIINQLIAEGFDINEDDFQHISPIPYKHIKRYGKFSFKEEIKVGQNGLRDLVKPRKQPK